MSQGRRGSAPRGTSLLRSFVPPSGHGMGSSPSWHQVQGAPPRLVHVVPPPTVGRRGHLDISQKSITYPEPQPRPTQVLLGSLTSVATGRPQWGTKPCVRQGLHGREGDGMCVRETETARDETEEGDR